MKIRIGDGTTYIGMDLAAAAFKVGDKVRITEEFDDQYGMVGEIVRHDTGDDSYLIEFEYDTPFGPVSNTAWYHNDHEFVLAHMPGNPPRVPTEYYCSHEWREDKWFTSKVFITCKKCGRKYEDS